MDFLHNLFMSMVYVLVKSFVFDEVIAAVLTFEDKKSPFPYSSSFTKSWLALHLIWLALHLIFNLERFFKVIKFLQFLAPLLI